MKRFFLTLKESAQAYGRDRAPRLAAALAYYTIFSLAPLLIIIIAVAGLVYGSDEARSQLVSQLQSSVGPDAASLIETMIERTAESGSGVLATIIGVATLLVGATTVFAQLQQALNEIWRTGPNRSRGILHLLLLRLRGLLMVLALGLLLVASFALQAALNVVLSNFSGWLPGSDWLWFAANQVLTIGLLTLLFSALFMVVPDAEVRWSEVWRGALLTAVLLKLGEVAIGIYLGASGVRSTYGAAGALVALLLFVYFSAQIILFGAEFTRADANWQEREAASDQKSGATA